MAKQKTEIAKNTGNDFENSKNSPELPKKTSNLKPETCQKFLEISKFSKTPENLRFWELSPEKFPVISKKN